MAKVEFRFDPFKLVGESRSGLTQSEIAEVYRETADLILEKTEQSLDAGESPVDGVTFKILKKKYADRQKGGDRTPNLLLTGDMWDAMRVRREGDKLVHTVLASQQPKADNHNKFSAASKKTPLPPRPFIPRKGETYRQEILDAIGEIIDSKRG